MLTWEIGIGSRIKTLLKWRWREQGQGGWLPGLHKCVSTALQVCAGGPPQSEPPQSEPPEGLHTRECRTAGKQHLASSGGAGHSRPARRFSVRWWRCLQTFHTDYWEGLLSGCVPTRYSKELFRVSDPFLARNWPWGSGGRSPCEELRDPTLR